MNHSHREWTTQRGPVTRVVQRPTTANDAESHSAGDPPIALKLDASACGQDFVSRLSSLTASTTGFDTDPVHHDYATASVRLSTTQSMPIKFWGGLVDSYLVDSASLQRVGAGQVNYTTALTPFGTDSALSDFVLGVPSRGLTPGTYGLVVTVRVTATVRVTGIADPPPHDCDLLISADAISLH
jgi:hypothetical protein